MSSCPRLSLAPGLNSRSPDTAAASPSDNGRGLNLERLEVLRRRVCACRQVDDRGGGGYGGERRQGHGGEAKGAVRMFAPVFLGAFELVNAPTRDGRFQVGGFDLDSQRKRSIPQMARCGSLNQELHNFFVRASDGTFVLRALEKPAKFVSKKLDKIFSLADSTMTTVFFYCKLDQSGGSKKVPSAPLPAWLDARERPPASQAPWHKTTSPCPTLPTAQLIKRPLEAKLKLKVLCITHISHECYVCLTVIHDARLAASGQY
ncbi:hypothetical protein GGX14DRAFT_388246 [Mycena pura]|uniref:Uncharacterized protein n=1 Tax=Mycena pura TaxID=153505 RepID=A0AAD6YL77_9AGAR|nr:hypothetical protein GGX14DRAFT_388246 [Mycena pura]